MALTATQRQYFIRKTIHGSSSVTGSGTWQVNGGNAGTGGSGTTGAGENGTGGAAGNIKDIAA